MRPQQRQQDHDRPQHQHAHELHQGSDLGRKHADRNGCGEHLRIQLCADLVALLAGLLVTALGGEREPAIGLAQVALDPDAATALWARSEELVGESFPT